ncbi:YqgE/AlgH family protein [Prolixibacteraceae bacterium JC049]|nr:YqgE/AlgH family protein [Prolixibacteraceae bacterium JC049]
MHKNPFKIESNNIAPTKGSILIAEPFLDGSYFSRSIILIAEYNNKEVVGFILNKAIDFPIRNFKEELPNFPTDVHLGGPVNPEYLYFIHTAGDIIPDSIQIVDNLYWGGSFDTLKELINDEKIKPSQVRFFLGYSGWTTEQLEQELKEDSWLVSNIDVNRIMKSSPDLWKDALKKLGGKYALWEHFPQDPSMN